ncbi:MAG: ROK family protein [Ruminococcaceae bacterium]|nr:ROK family protein [Oscillospiraceae bacterium]
MYFGMDIGGTCIKYGIVDTNLQIVEKAKEPTEKTSENALLEQLCNIAYKMSKKYNFEYIGICAPGYVNDKDGIISGSSNTPFKNTGVKEYIEKKTGKKVFLSNDANCAAYGEYLFGDRSVSNSIMLTLGTGVGGGIILNRKLYVGSEYRAGELGHMVIVNDGEKCGCGKFGCLEQYASATALVRMTKEQIENGSGIMSEELKGKCTSVDGTTVFNYYKKGCSDAEEVLNQYTRFLVCGIENYIDIFNPDEIVLSGGITNDSDILMTFINKTFSGRCKIRISKLKNDAGLFGAALLGYQHK